MGAGDVAFDEILGGRVSLPALIWWLAIGDGVEVHTWLVVPKWNMQVCLGRLRVRYVYVVEEKTLYRDNKDTHLVDHIGN